MSGGIAISDLVPINDQATSTLGAGVFRANRLIPALLRSGILYDGNSNELELQQIIGSEQGSGSPISSLNRNEQEEFKLYQEQGIISSVGEELWVQVRWNPEWQPTYAGEFYKFSEQRKALREARAIAKKYNLSIEGEIRWRRLVNYITTN